MAFVLDGSVALAWFVRQQATIYTDRIRRLAKREALHVPAVWPLEIANALHVPLACRDGKLQLALAGAGVRLA